MYVERIHLLGGLSSVVSLSTWEIEGDYRLAIVTDIKKPGLTTLLRKEMPIGYKLALKYMRHYKLLGMILEDL